MSALQLVQNCVLGKHRRENVLVDITDVPQAKRQRRFAPSPSKRTTRFSSKEDIPPQSRYPLRNTRERIRRNATAIPSTPVLTTYPAPVPIPIPAPVSIPFSPSVLAKHRRDGKDDITTEPQAKRQRQDSSPPLLPKRKSRLSSKTAIPTQSRYPLRLTKERARRSTAASPARIAAHTLTPVPVPVPAPAPVPVAAPIPVAAPVPILAKRQRNTMQINIHEEPRTKRRRHLDPTPVPTPAPLPTLTRANIPNHIPTSLPNTAPEPVPTPALPESRSIFIQRLNPARTPTPVPAPFPVCASPCIATRPSVDTPASGTACKLRHLPWDQLPEATRARMISQYGDVIVRVWRREQRFRCDGYGSYCQALGLSPCDQSDEITIWSLLSRHPELKDILRNFLWDLNLHLNLYEFCNHREYRYLSLLNLILTSSSQLHSTMSSIRRSTRCSPK